MRWFWIDRFETLVSGQRAVATKNISLSEEPLDDYNPGYPYYPNSLVIEGMAQAGGILVSQINDFTLRVVLAKVNRSQFHFNALPGDQLTIEVELLSVQSSGAVVSGVSRRGDEVQAEVELVFAYLGDGQFEGVELFEPASFCRMLRCMKMWDVGQYPDGSPIEIPPHMLAAEQAELATIVPEAKSISPS